MLFAWFWSRVLRYIMCNLQFDYIEDAFYRAVVLEKDKRRASSMWYMIYKLWYKHPMNKHLKDVKKRVYGTTET